MSPANTTISFWGIQLTKWNNSFQKSSFSSSGFLEWGAYTIRAFIKLLSKTIFSINTRVAFATQWNFACVIKVHFVYWNCCCFRRIQWTGLQCIPKIIRQYSTLSSGQVSDWVCVCGLHPMPSGSWIPAVTASSIAWPVSVWNETDVTALLWLSLLLMVWCHNAGCSYCLHSPTPRVVNYIQHCVCVWTLSSAVVTSHSIICSVCVVLHWSCSHCCFLLIAGIIFSRPSNLCFFQVHVFIPLNGWAKVMPSVLWRCWLGGRKGIRPVKTEWRGTGMVICLEQGANDLHMVQLMPLPPHHLVLQ